MSELKVDTLTGKTTAGDITVTSEGGAATQSLQQGLAKAWCYIISSGNVISDSLNVGTVTDNGVGDYQPNFVNVMSSVNFNTAITSGNHSTSHNCSGSSAQFTTSQFRIRCANGAETAVIDLARTHGLIHGELA